MATFKPRDPVEVVDEVTLFRTTSGALYTSMDLACDAQEAEDFRTWCDDQDISPEVADTILRTWKVSPK